jgi:hypothetical protein
MAGQNFLHSQRGTRYRHGNQRTLLETLLPRKKALRITAQRLHLAPLPARTRYGGAAGSSVKSTPVLQMPPPLVMPFKGTAATMPPTVPNIGTPASTTPKQVSTADSSTGQPTAGAPGEKIPTADPLRSRPLDQTDRDDRARSRSAKRISAAEKVKTDLAAELTANALAAAAEKVVTDKATTHGAAAAAPPPDNEPAAADAAETSEQQTDPPRKHRRTKSGEHNTDDDMSDTGLEDKQS